MKIDSKYSINSKVFSALDQHNFTAIMWHNKEIIGFLLFWLHAQLNSTFVDIIIHKMLHFSNQKGQIVACDFRDRNEYQINET